MIVKLAILFLCAMAALGLVFGRSRKRKRIGGQKPRRGDPEAAKAVRCPSCGSWIVEGSRCPCGGGEGGGGGGDRG